jgi:hypothetical protein
VRCACDRSRFRRFLGMVDLDVDAQGLFASPGEVADSTPVLLSPVHPRRKSTGIATTRHMLRDETKLLSIQSHHFDSALIEPIVWVTNKFEAFPDRTSLNDTLTPLERYPGDGCEE